MKKLLLISALALLLFNACEKKFYEGDPSPVIAIGDVRKLFKGTELTLTSDQLNGASAVRGMVISDALSGNVLPGTIVIQNFKKGVMRGIVLNLGTSSSNYTMGDSLLVDIVGGTLKSVEGCLQISGIDASKIKKVSSNNTVAPVILTTYQLDSLRNNYEATLVKVYSASITPNPEPTTTYAGDYEMSDGTKAIKLHTEATASFAGKRLMGSATYVGIPLSYQANTSVTSEVRLWPRAATDITDEAGSVYPGYPETFEGKTKTSYTSPSTVTFDTGTWGFTQSLLGNSSTDRKVLPGTQAIRFQQNLSTSAYIQMNFNLSNGASKVSFTYGSFSTDAPSTFRLEYSTNNGTTWVPAGPNISNPSATAQVATYLLNITGNVRFRINKLGLGTTDNISINNGRLNIDNFAVYAK